MVLWALPTKWGVPLRIRCPAQPAFMPVVSESVFFENRAGQVLAHPAGYAVLRYRPARRQPGDLAALLTHLGRLLLAHGWTRFLADNRQMTPFSQAEKEWFVQNWLGLGPQAVPRPAPLQAALVLPAEVIARLSITQMMNEANPASLAYRAFSELAPAEAYLAGRG